MTADLPLFMAGAWVEVPLGHDSRVIWIDPSDYAALAATGRDGAALLVMAERCANAILDAQGSFCIWELRIALGKLGLMENLGAEKLDALGSLGRRMGLKAGDSERPPSWACLKLAKSHSNRNTRWYRPDATTRARQLDDALTLSGRK